MNAPSKDISTFLDANIGSLTFTTNLFTVKIPARYTGLLVCIYDTGGFNNIDRREEGELV